MIKIYLFIIFLSSLITVAQGKELPSFKCDSQIRELVKKWNTSDEWETRGESIYLSPTADFGEWIVVAPDSGGITITKATESNEIRVHFSASCERMMKVEEKPFPTSMINGDGYLKDKIKEGKGVIYLWSSHMPLSVKGIPEIEKAAKELGIKTIILMDKKSRGMKKSQVLESFDLKMRNAYLHYPSLLVFESGKIKNVIKYGFEKKNEYKKNIQDMLTH